MTIFKSIPTFVQVCALASFAMLLGFMLPMSNANAQGQPGPKIRICHATDSHSNPYTNPEVDQDAVDGDLGNDNGQGDHYLEHNGPVWYSGIADHSWGDVIPPIEGVHGGKNWTAEGQAFWNNSCNLPSASPSPSPSASVEPSPSATPSASVTPSPAPSPSTTPGPQGKQVSMGVDVGSCSNGFFDAVADLTENGNPIEGVEVTFNYNPEAKAKTNAQGRARVTFPQLAEGPVTAKADGYPTQTAYVTFRSEKCQGIGGAVLGTSTETKPKTTGQVLGATTLANTGASDITIAFGVLGAGIIGTLVSIRSYLVATVHAKKN
jgi:hypothetical protein